MKKASVPPPLSSARESIAPVLTHAVEKSVPVLVAARDIALDKGTELLTSEKAVEARRRGAEVIRAVKGELPPRKRRWPLALGFLAVGGAIGAAASFIAQRLRTPVPEFEPYAGTDDALGTSSSETEAPESVTLTTEVSKNGGASSPISGAAPSV